MLPIYLAIGFSIISAGQCKAQWSFGPVVGIDIGNNPDISAAIGYATPVPNAHGDRIGEWGFALGVGMGMEDAGRIIPRLSFWMAGWPAIGCRLALYPGVENPSLVVVPEVGLGLYGCRLVWGFPFVLAGPNVEEISLSRIGIYFFYPLDRKGWD